ncbi:hypothetical protein [Engelhardtia mirabilis]|uniref:Prenyltransferase and squalene oxidase repeat protein n=1 Tax=Engelhardtia mirabilis TaxID=2528011 RepID=A0A518BRL4_9BACT|nr:hypothetical protein Pla133_47350 [Planctomycetes bacterium Pla133]QDV03941.1 hypothetical protein Pla86_47330 [Planctomycetes bacterium Pla86]
MVTIRSHFVAATLLLLVPGSALAAGPPQEPDTGGGQTGVLGLGTSGELKRRTGALDRLPRKTCAAVDRGLDWLARHQRPDGAWDADGFGSLCADEPCGGPGPKDGDVRATALALLALTGGAQSLRDGEHADAVRAGVAFLRRQQDAESGAIGRAETAPGLEIAPVPPALALETHALATAALCDACALTRDPILAPSCRAAVEHLVTAVEGSRADGDRAAGEGGSAQGRPVAATDRARTERDLPAGAIRWLPPVVAILRDAEFTVPADAVGAMVASLRAEGAEGAEGAELRPMAVALGLRLLPAGAEIDGRRAAIAAGLTPEGLQPLVADPAERWCAAWLLRELDDAARQPLERALDAAILETRGSLSGCIGGSFPPVAGLDGGRVEATALALLAIEARAGNEPLDRD